MQPLQKVVFANQLTLELQITISAESVWFMEKDSTDQTFGLSFVILSVRKITSAG